MKALSLVVLTLLANICIAQKTWNSAVPSNWNNAANWTPAGVPALNDIVIFDGAIANGNCTVDIQPPNLGAIQITANYTADINLNGNDFIIAPGTAATTFNNGTISGPVNSDISITSNFAASFAGTDLGTNVTLTAVLGTANGIFTGGAGTVFGGPVTITAHSILLNGSTYESTASFTKNSGAAAGASTGDGGNWFKGSTTIVNAMNAAFISANVNPDIFDGLLTLSLNGTSPSCKINMAHVALNNQFNNHIRVRTEDNSSMATIAATSEISFGANGGTSTLAATYTITEVNNTYDPDGAVDEFLWGDLYLNNFTQLGNTVQTINLQIPENESPSVMRMKLKIRNCVFNGAVNFSASNLFLSYSTFNGGPTNTFIKTRGGGSDANPLYNPIPHATSSSDGGNTFNNTTAFQNLGQSTMGFALVAGDIFNGNVSFRCGQTASHFKIAHAGTTHFKGNVSISEFAAGVPIVQFGDNVQGGIAEFDGSAAQSLLFTAGQAFTVNFYNLKMNNSNGLSLTGFPITITTNLDLTLGLINPTNTITFLDNATASNASNASYVNGAVLKSGDDAFTFPTGSGGGYHPIGISAPNTVTSVFSAQHFYANHGLGTANDGTMQSISVCESWNVTRVADAAQVNATLWWNDTHECSGDYITDPNDLVVARWSGAQWQNFGGAAITTESPGGHVTSTIQLSSNSNTLTFGSISSDNTLPIELIALTVDPSDEGAELNWQTASETNNDFFTIERRDENKFVSLGTVAGAGTTYSLTNYTWTDTNPRPGLSYYRLRQTDFDGDETISNVVSFRWDKPGVPYPNPVKNLLYLDRLSFDENSRVQITDVSGRVVYYGNATRTIDCSELNVGVYHLMISTKESVRWYSIKKD